MINPDLYEFLDLNHGWKALVNADRYPELSKHKWCIHKQGQRVYARRKKPGVNRHILLHQVILLPKPGFTIDHKNTDTPFCVLDERRSNLRYATKREQRLNSRRQLKALGKFKGTTFTKGKWQAQIKIGEKQTYLGRFVTPEAAAHAYDYVAKQHFKEFAKLNFPESK